MDYTISRPEATVLPSEQMGDTGRHGGLEAQTSGYDTMVTFLLLFTSRKSFQSTSFSLQGKQGQGGGGVRCALPSPWLVRGHAHTYCMSVWTWSCRCWDSCGPPRPGAVVRKLRR